VTRYCEPWRAYHVLGHIHDCLSELDRERGLARNPDAVEAALWFHDAVYVPMRPDNEARSADLAAAALERGGVAGPLIATVRELVLDTRHDLDPESDDGRLISDVDLAILGAEPARFERYEQAVRQEYSELPAPAYRMGRLAVLGSFVARRFLYFTDPFRERYEAAARANLDRLREALRAPTFTAAEGE